MKKINPYLGMTPNTLAAAAILQAMELQLKAAKVLLTGRPSDQKGLQLVDDVTEAGTDVVESILKTLEKPAVKRLAAPPPEKEKPAELKGMDNFTEVPETTALILTSMGTREFFGISQIAEKAGVSTETVRRYLHKVLLPNKYVQAGEISRPSSPQQAWRPGYRKIEVTEPS